MIRSWCHCIRTEATTWCHCTRTKTTRVDRQQAEPVPHPQKSKLKVAPMTESSPNVIEIKVDRLIDDMRFLTSRMTAFDKRLNTIEDYLKPSEPSEQQPESKFTPWFAAAARRSEEHTSELQSLRHLVC